MATDPQDHASSLASVESLILRRASTVKQSNLAAATNRAESHISRILSGDNGIRINELHTFLDALGLSIVESGDTDVRLSQDEYQALRTLARKGLE